MLYFHANALHQAQQGLPFEISPFHAQLSIGARLGGTSIHRTAAFCSETVQITAARTAMHVIMNAGRLFVSVPSAGNIGHFEFSIFNALVSPFDSLPPPLPVPPSPPPCLTAGRPVGRDRQMHAQPGCNCNCTLFPPYSSVFPLCSENFHLLDPSPMILPPPDPRRIDKTYRFVNELLQLRCYRASMCQRSLLS